MKGEGDARPLLTLNAYYAQGDVRVGLDASMHALACSGGPSSCFFLRRMKTGQTDTIHDLRDEVKAAAFLLLYDQHSPLLQWEDSCWRASDTLHDLRDGAIKRRIGLVTQDDVLLPQLTVDETLVAAFLRLPGNIIRRQRNIRRRKKRKGYEILVDPSLLLLDEPTSGLDSTSANRLLQILQGLAKAGRTIITTIHQPSSRMFHMFDKLLLISEGYPLYYGKARESMECFSDLRFIPEIAMNPAEFLLDLATGVNDISVPEDLSAPNGVLDSEKAVINIINS
uniref:ABC transporter domain-containing protein n=1 Tax=Populus alba TaxID=43335 RepID=A0A4U5P6P9_POPAL|nr:hypothetical protein D5086_0000222620 [Populus alba]